VIGAHRRVTIQHLASRLALASGHRVEKLGKRLDAVLRRLATRLRQPRLANRLGSECASRLADRVECLRAATENAGR
jgi:hypothetical protein